ncbi:glycoside hydrolase family 25 protein [Actinacidiphila sp. bgisy145]|uniref:glycoside hydrolase family 25 protein n=1 Tax=Actinacidiphila sp. bgisy145 TaxID=3413792 RepID=UPI003EBED03B
MTVKGIDVASYQSSTFSTSGLAFVWVKCTEGTGYVNPRYSAQIAHARAAGAVVGHYHFVRPGSMSAQLAYFLAHADLRAGDMLCLDWEDTGVSCADKDTWIKAAQAKQPTHRVLLYCNLDFWLHRDTTSFAGDGLWIADPSATAGSPRITHPWVMHQYSSAGGTDRNVAAFADLAALKAWANKTTSSSTEEDTLTISDADAKKIAAAVIACDAVPAARPPYANDDYAKGNTTWTLGYSEQTSNEGIRKALDGITKLTAQLAALSSVVAKLASGGGITAEQVQAAAEAGAQAALAELGDRLQAPATDA